MPVRTRARIDNHRRLHRLAPDLGRRI